jgi:hypothetical protein
VTTADAGALASHVTGNTSHQWTMKVQTQSMTMNATCALSTHTKRTREFYYTPTSGKYKDRTPTRPLPIVSWLSCPRPDMTRSWVDVDAVAVLLAMLCAQGVHFES